MRRLIFPVLLGIAGCAVLVALGVWQVQRLGWKEAVLAQIDARIAEAPVDLPESPTEAEDEYRAVTVTGALGGAEVLVFAPVEGLGIGYRVLSVLIAGDRAVLVDLGFIPQDDAAVAESRMAERVTVTGNLLWPDDTTSATPPPDPRTGIWYGRDVEGISALLGSEPVLVVARDLSPADLNVTPVPVTSAGIPNDHLNYAITWFLLAAVWAGMSGYLIWRIVRRKD